MPKLLRLVSRNTGATSSAGPLPDLVTESVFTLENVVSVSVAVSRDHANPSVIKGMALLLSAVGGVAAPIATISAMDDAVKVAQFQTYASEVLDKICSVADVIVIDVKTF